MDLPFHNLLALKEKCQPSCCCHIICHATPLLYDSTTRRGSPRAPLCPKLATSELESATQ